MGKGRLEAFSDGVIAILITIMVLELKVPHGGGADLADLWPLLPVFLSYVLSFVFLGVYWMNHHHLLQAVRHVDGRVLWANMHLLFWLSLIPFTTAWMGENDFAEWPVAMYGIVLLGAAISYFSLTRALIARHGEESVLAKAVGATRVIIVGRGPRLDLARELGADDVVDITTTDTVKGILALTGGRGADCAFECAGTPEAVVASINCVKRGGRVALVGLTGNKDVSFNTDRLALDEVDIFGVRSSPNAYPELINLIAAGRVNVKKLVSRLYPLEQINDAFDAFRKREGGAIRMVIQI